MSEEEEPNDPDAIQLDGIDPAEGELVDAPASQSPSSRGRTAPPPLPAVSAPGSNLPAPEPDVRSTGSKILYGVVIAVMLAVAAAGGLYFAKLIRPNPALTPAPPSAVPDARSAPPEAVLTASATPVAAPSAKVLTLPEVDIH